MTVERIAGTGDERFEGITRRGFLHRGAAAGVALSGVAGLLAACEGAGPSPGTGAVDKDDPRAKVVIWDMASRVQSPDLWNPIVPGMRDDNGFESALMEPLFILNYETGEIEPWLGESLTPNDTLDVWTLKIRDGVKWSDGEDYDADDVVFTITLLKDGPPELSNAAAMNEWVKAVVKLDKLTVEFTLTKPNPRFQLDYFSVKIFRNVPILPEHIWRGKDALTFKNYDPEKGWPVFTGPYKLASTSPTKCAWERDPNWWGVKAKFKPLPKPERLEFVVAETEEVRVARATNNEVDVLDDITTGAYESLHGRNEAFVAWNPEKPYSWADPCTRLLSMNNTVPPWDDRDMRWAVNFAVDKDEIVRIAYEGSTTKAPIFFPPYKGLNDYVDLLEAEGLFEEFPIMRHDPDKARETIESKGYTADGDGFYRKDGKPLRMRIDVPSEGTELSRYAEVIGEQLQAIGIDATVRKLAFGIFADNLSKGKFEAAADFFACGSVSEPWYSMNLFHERNVAPVGTDSAGNSVRWKNSVYSKNVDAMAGLPLGDPRIDAPFIAAAREWLRDLPFFPAAHAKKLYSFNTRYWVGWPSIDDPYIHPPTVWNSSHRIIHNLRPAT
ncbi:ABC transporter substrate-binding protein [Actinopolymorpha sp. B9G3]|uniref:ABC transporter substrate-binding protein n=1 Tax=Actinopolymorpha sp. B9G3 TaxID=3158970 RepID=UPI0032D8CAD4